jgi:sec-independent protein translocase protein TatC
VPYGIYALQNTLPQDLAEFRAKLDEYMEFLSNTCLWAGITFQLPIVMQVLIRLDIVAAKTFSRFRKHFIVASFLISGIITPGADPYSQTLLAIPMWFLYELGILMGRWSVWRAKKASAGAAT